ncbi:ABC transporter permease subunit [Ktedonosporobacter rubrisoli]|uniref:ABC transporter permease subunit n=1 Tax=Ktedonosporobacter rubrisoli TaxID=2509675 RepID=A0A4P6JTU3_KTERU|nr:ABC transporter permease subunit [Ktedonosporobacter rubrisoli]QBD78702.1 ABC transporter permease subunit [Ktedonosporobacter rubrisoli]
MSTVKIDQPQPSILFGGASGSRFKLGQALRTLGFTLLLIALGIFILGPLVILCIWAFAKEWFFPALLPQTWTFDWWQQILLNGDIGHSIALSFIIAPIVTLLSAVICLPAAYAFARYEFPGRRFFLISLFATNAFPKMGLYITMAGLLYAFQLMNTLWGVVLVQLLNTLVVMTWIPSAAFASVPRALEEAARDAGAGPWTTFWKVTLPMALPGILVALILAFLTALDEAQGTFLVGAPDYMTMPVQMYTLVSNYPQQAAAVFSIILSIPSCVLLILVRRYVIGGSLAAGFHIR